MSSLLYLSLNLSLDLYSDGQVQLERQHEITLDHITEVGTSFFEVHALSVEALGTRDFADNDTVFIPEVLGALKGSFGILRH